MAKVSWATTPPYDYLTPALQQAYWGVDANTGHTHDGTDNDGSVPKVDLTAHVTGLLPNANLQTSGLTSATISTSHLTVAEVFTIEWVRIGNQVHLHIPQATGTSNANTLVIDPTTTWDSNILAYTNSAGNGPRKIISVIDNGENKIGQIELPTAVSDSITVQLFDSGNFGSTDFTNTGTKGLQRYDIGYIGA